MRSPKIDYLNLGFRCELYEAEVWDTVHRHDEVEFNFIHRGMVQFRYGETVYQGKDGDLLLYWGSVPHQLICADPGVRCDWISIPLRQIFQWQLPQHFIHLLLNGTFIFDQGSLRRKESNQEWMERCYEYLQEGSVEANKIVMLQVEARMREIALKSNLHESGDSGSAQVRVGKIEEIIRFLAKNYTGSISVETVAKEVGYTEKYCNTFFRKHCGMGIGEYLTKLRIAHAQRLLVTTDHKIIDLALDAGFGSVSNFYAIFKKVCNCSPRDYRSRSLGTNS